MTPLLIALALQTAPVPAAPAPAPAPATHPQAAAPGADAPSSPADTLAGLEETYRVSCGQTGILYYGYAELCDSLRKQIAEYRNKVDRDAEAAVKSSPKP
jgi:hypothetical protein